MKFFSLAKNWLRVYKKMFSAIGSKAEYEIELALINSKKDLESGNFFIESPEEHLNRIK